MAVDPERRAHQEWLGYVQPVGLVVSPPALLAAQAHVNRNIAPDHRRFLEAVTEVAVNGESPVAAITDLPGFVQSVLGWEAGDLVGVPGGEPLPPTLEVALPEHDDTLRPTYAVPELDPPEHGPQWLMLVSELPAGADLDAASGGDEHRWQASPQARFERLLRETRVPIGLLCNATHLRLVYAPRGETSGNATFRVQDMTEVAGRPIFAALHMLLSAERLFSLPPRQRLPAILADSRRYQNVVSTKLAEQVLVALYELLRGFQAADDHRHGELLREVLRSEPDHVYAGLLTVLLRLVFILYAEDRGLLSTDPVYTNHYSVSGLYEQLRDDASRHPDTMDLRYGAWARLLTLFRLIHDGARHAGLHLPARHGHLFNPDRYPFLEGRPWHAVRQHGERLDPPMVADGVVFRVLEKLLVLDGERLSYRSLDVEQIGSVYETMMGFSLETARGRSIAVKPRKRHGAPATVNLEELLEQPPGKRARWLRDAAEQKITGRVLSAVKEATTPEGMVAALGARVATEATPNIVPPGAMVLQPSDERRRSGSHYTPRSLTEPIVRTTLRPVLEQLGERPTPEQILGLKVCDPAMGSGAFLVEACRQLGDTLVKAWRDHDQVPAIPPDEDEVLHARRLVAQRCLYGVDKNPLATDLAKLSLWLATLARDHAFTFLDHALRTGDSLVGLSRDQVAGFHWAPTTTMPFVQLLIEKQLKKAAELRRAIQHAGDEVDEASIRLLLKEADETLDDLRLIGDLVISAFFRGSKRTGRERLRRELAERVEQWLRSGEGRGELRELGEEMRDWERPVLPFHWEIELPEVFGRENPGFDAVVGNPPFAGKNTVVNGNAPGFLDWLKIVHVQSHGNADLVAHFFRRAHTVIRRDGCFGLIATNTIGQGDTRSTGLRWICTHGGTIYAARKRLRWPGLAAVVVSVVHVVKGERAGPFDLDGREAPLITAFLFHAGGHDDPAPLAGQAERSFQGSIVLGMGFTFDDTDSKGVASPIAEMHRLIAKDPRNAERIFPYIGGEEVNSSPTHAHHRYVVSFGQMSEEEARQWPDLMAIVEARVKPKRDRDNRASYRSKWWHFAEKRGDLYRAIAGLERVLAVARVGQHGVFTFLPTGTVYSEQLVVVALESHAAFCGLQSRPHEVWARFFGSSMKDDLRYTPTDCFDTFPFPPDFETDPTLEAAGQAYHDFRADLMVRNDEGLTRTYNRFHDPDERSLEIMRLRELHDAMDRAVLDAYGWTDIRPTCELLLDYEEEDEDDDGRSRKRRKPWRYRWPDEIHDEVLARLLELNQRRAREERLAGKVARGKSRRTAPRARDTDNLVLPFGDEEDDA